MERFANVLLDIWREVCRHIEIGESIERVVPILARRLAPEAVIIRHIDRPRSCVETVALAFGRSGSAPTGESAWARTEIGPADLERLSGWCRQGKLLRGQAASLRSRLPGLVPDGLEGRMLVGPLVVREASLGALLLVLPRRSVPRDDQVELFRSLLEPFTVAVENDQRLRELVSLREALEADKRSLLSRLGRHDISDSIVGAETGLKSVMEQIDLVAQSDAPALVLGETGSGKEVVARAIHTRSRRAKGPFLRVNCGAIPPELVDSELFGHEKGSFTGALGQRKGWFERADGGTLFLDECGELPPAAQVRLLRVLQDGMLERVGGERPVHVDVRIVAATHRDLQTMVADGRFRQDLWYRIAVFPILLPPLRERRADIPALATHFALRAANRLGMTPMAPSVEDIGLLLNYAWPGNVRELAAVIERAAILGGGIRLEIERALGTILQAAPMPRNGEATSASLAPLPPGSSGDVLTLDAAMARHIEGVLARTRGRIEGPQGAAFLLGINPHTLRARMRKLRLDWKRFRQPSVTGPNEESAPGRGHEFESVRASAVPTGTEADVRHAKSVRSLRYKARF